MNSKEGMFELLIISFCILHVLKCGNCHSANMHKRGAPSDSRCVSLTAIHTLKITAYAGCAAQSWALW